MKTPAGFKDAYLQFCENGWNGLTKTTEYGGQGLPHLLGTAVEEMWHSSNLAFNLCPMLTQGAIEAIELRGSAGAEGHVPAEHGRRHLDRHDEPHRAAGRIRPRRRAHARGPAGRRHVQALRPEDLHHLRRARLHREHHPSRARADARRARRRQGHIAVRRAQVSGQRRRQRSARATTSTASRSSTSSAFTRARRRCMAYGDHGGAIGYLVGEENRGLEYMFIMMNLARFSVGMEGVGIAERAYQRAAAYAKERVQGRPIGAASRRAPRATIIDHPDIRRMLMTMRAHTEAMRAVAYVTCAAMDNAHRHPDAEARKRHQAFVDFMIPIVKGCSTETAQEVASLGIQVHGGMGFIEETGAAQHFRDARITTIYEGTTGIQANDFIGRKTARDGGAMARVVADEMDKVAGELGGARRARASRRSARGSPRRCARSGPQPTGSCATGGASPRAAHAVAVPYLQAMGTRRRRLAARPRCARGGKAPRRRRRRRAVSRGQDPHRALLRRGAAAAGGGLGARSSPTAARRRCRSPPSSSERQRRGASRERGAHMSAAGPSQGANCAPAGGSDAAPAACVGAPT